MAAMQDYTLMNDRRCILSQLGHTRLGLRNSRADTREEGCVVVYRQRRLDGQLHLHTLPISQIRWAKIRHCHEQQRILRLCQHCCCMGTADLAYGAEQETKENWRKCVLRLLMHELIPWLKKIDF